MTQSTEELLLAVFRRALGLPDGMTPDRIRRDDLAEWDSVGHMQLVSELESEFGIRLEFEEVLSLDSFEQARAAVERGRV